MPIPTVKGYMPLAVTPRSLVCDEQGVGQWPMWKRYDSLRTIIEQQIDEPYRDFLALPYHEIDKLKGEELFYWYTPRTDTSFLRLSKTDDEYSFYKEKLKETLALYRAAVQRLKDAGMTEEANFLQLALKYAGDIEDAVFCGDDKVVVTVWGMKPRKGYDIGDSTIEKELFPAPSLHTVTFVVGQYGNTPDATSLKKRRGSSIKESQIPHINVADGYVFYGWDKDPIGISVESDMTFTAQYHKIPEEKTYHHVRFLLPDGSLLSELDVEHGKRIPHDYIPPLPVVNGMLCLSWNHAPEANAVLRDRDYTAVLPPENGPSLYSVRFLSPDGAIIYETKVMDGETLKPESVPPLPSFNGMPCTAWDGDPLNDIIHSDRDYHALTPEDPKTIHTVRFLMPDGVVIQQVEVEHDTTLSPDSIPPLPVVNGVTATAWDGDPLNDIILSDRDYTALLPDSEHHTVRFLTPDGGVIQQVDVEHNTSLSPDSIPPLPVVNGVTATAWDGDPLNDIILSDRDYTALLPDVDQHTVRFLMPDGTPISQFQVAHGQHLSQQQVPPLPVIDGKTCTRWDSDPLDHAIDKDTDFTAIKPKNPWGLFGADGCLSALLHWLLLALGLLLLFLLLRCFVFDRCHFNLCGNDCGCDEPQVLPYDPRPSPDPTPTPVPHTGDVQIYLEWSNYNDLDISCTDPYGQTISYVNKHVNSGGQLDIDMNANGEKSNHPIENIYWPSGGAPKGQYTVVLTYYAQHDNNVLETPYKIKVKHMDKEDTYTGTMTSVNQKKIICTFVID